MGLLDLSHYISRKFDYPFFRPKSFLPGPFGDETAVTATFRGDKLNRGIVLHSGAQEGFIRYEWIVLRGNQQQRYADLCDDTLRPGCFVIFRGILVAELRSGNRVVKLPHGANRPEAIFRISFWK